MFDLHGEQSEYADETIRNLDLSGREIAGKAFHNCTFIRCALAGAVLRACRFAGCTLKQCDLNLVRVPETVLADTRFEDCRVTGVNWTEAEWSRGRLAGAIGFHRCVLSHSTFIGLRLESFAATECTALDVDFREASLQRADFRHTDLTGSLFAHSDLTGADFRQAKDYTIDPSLNALKGARFSLPEALSLLLSLGITLEE